MSRGLLFWIIVLLWLVFGLWLSWGTPLYMGGAIIVFVLLVLLGWQVFGPPVH